jgi:hypothetical protein
MNEDKLRNTMEDVKKVLEKLALRATNDPEKDNMFAMDVEIATTDGIIELFYLYVTVKEDYAPAHEKEKPLVILIELKIDYKLDDDQLIKTLELINLINRQSITGHLLVDLADKIVVLKKDIKLLKGRLSRVELEWSINELLNNASFYCPLIMKRINSNETLDERAKSSWVKSSYLHKECRSGK